MRAHLTTTVFVFLFWLLSVQASAARPIIATHTPLTGWTAIMLDVVAKDFDSMSITRKVGHVDRMTPIYSLAPKARYLTTKRKKQVKAVMQWSFNRFRYQTFPTPSQWGVRTNKGLEIYCGNQGVPPISSGVVLGWASPHCIASVPSTRFSTLHLSKALLNMTRYSPWELLITAVHETFHIIQFQSPLTDQCDPSKSMPSWWQESTSDAFGFFAMKTMPRKLQNTLGFKPSQVPLSSQFGIRNYYKYPLDHNGDTKKTGMLPYYTSSFWTLISKRYYSHYLSRYSFLKRMLWDRSLLKLKKNKWDFWLTLTNKWFLKEVRRTLPNLFATFVTEMAAFQRSKAFKRNETSLLVSLRNPTAKRRFPRWLRRMRRDGGWQRKLFGGCKRITLYANARRKVPKATTISLKMLTAKCIRVVIKGLRFKPTIPAVKLLTASLPSTHIAEQLQLGLATTNSAASYACVRNLKGAHRVAHCLLPKKVSQTKKGRYNVFWRTFAQRRYEGQRSIENLYVLSRVPVARKGCIAGRGNDPACIAKMTANERKAVRVRIRIALKATILQQKFASIANSRNNTGSLDTKTAVNTHETMMARIGMHAAGRDLESLPLSGHYAKFNRSRPLAPLFRGNVFNLRLSQKLRSMGQHGLRVIRLEHNRVIHSSQALGDVDFKTLHSFYFVTPKPVSFGRTGTFRGEMVGRGAGNSSTAFFVHKTFPKAQIKIYEFSKNILRARLTATLCKISYVRVSKSLEKRCPPSMTHKLSVDILSPFPQYYTAQTLFRPVQTPSVRQFLKYDLPDMLKRTKAARQANPIPSSARSGGTVTGGLGGLGGGSSSCTCSCKEKERYLTLQKRLQANPNGAMPAGFVALASCLGRCLIPWSKCKATKGGCDCSCATYRKRTKEQQALVRKGSSTMTPELKSWMRCMPMCAMNYAKCF